MAGRMLQIRGNLETAYADVFTPEAVAALEALAGMDPDRKTLMTARIERRAARARNQQRITFLDPQATIGRTQLKVQDARAGAFIGTEIPHDLRRQWIQGTGPAARPNAPVETSLRNVAYALLSGADGWMFDGEDALGQVSTMSLDNQRNLKLAVHRDPVFTKVAEQVAGEMNQWAHGFFCRLIIDDWKKQLDFTTRIFRARGLNLDAITMTYGYMRTYEDRVRRACNTPDQLGRYALWQGGMEPNIPVGSAAGVSSGMKRAVAGAEREQREGASGKWVAHWKMVHIVRPVWEKVGQDNQLGRQFPPLTYTPADADGLFVLEPAPRTVRGARDLLSVALQYGNAFEQGFQAAALKPADFFGNDDVLYLMEDMATGEIRVSILWEWLHKGAQLTEDDPETGARAGDTFDLALFARLLDEEYEKLLVARDRDVHDDSKRTTLPIAREIVATYVTNRAKLPWYIDLLNLNLNNHDLANARSRIRSYIEAFEQDGTRITENLDFVV